MVDQLKWDKRFLHLAGEISRWSRDPSTKVGAVVVDRYNRVVGTGYNGFPIGVEDTPERYLDRETKYNLMVHAEENALWTAGERARGSTLYVWAVFHCHDCSKAVIQTGIERVVIIKPSPEDRDLLERWEESISLSKMMLTKAGVEIVEVEL